MKRISLLFAVALISMAAMAQTAVIEFNSKTYDFGQVREDGGRVSTTFEFTNTGNAPLVLSNVRASCGCTATNWSKAPIEPGQKGSVTATYNPNGRPGVFTKTITVTSNASESTVRLTIKGEVLPKGAKPADKYPVKIGELGLTQRNVQFGGVKKGEIKHVDIEVANNSAEAVSVDLQTAAQGIIVDVQPSKIEAGKAGTIRVAIDTDAAKQWGPFDTDAYLVVNGKKILDADHKINIKANIVENFSKLSAADKQLAPMIKLSQSNIDLGVIKAGTSKTVKVDISNQGAQNPLYIRRIVNTANEVKATPKATTIKAGKSTTLNITLNTTGLNTQTYRRSITVINNDPDHSRQTINISWTVAE